MDISWIYHGYIMDISWIYHGYIMDISWIYHGYIRVAGEDFIRKVGGTNRDGGGFFLGPQSWR